MATVTFQIVAAGNEYACHPDHRNGNTNKSQWSISEENEILSFKETISRKWKEGSRAWGLHYSDGKPNYLGVTADRIRRLFVARFEDANQNQKWHGYPADHQRKSNDRLPESLKRIWITEGVLPPAKVRKLAKGESCSL